MATSAFIVGFYGNHPGVQDSMAQDTGAAWLKGGLEGFQLDRVQILTTKYNKGTGYLDRPSSQ